MREKILLMGPPGSGKSHQAVKVVKLLEDYNVPVFIIDLEDKMGAMLEAMGAMPKNLLLYKAFEWTEEEAKDSDGGLLEVMTSIEKESNPGDWIIVDRVDLTWNMVQRWFVREKFKMDLASKMVEKSKSMTKGSMFMPVFDQGSWQVINENYEGFIHRLLYRSRCNILVTTGIKGADQSSPVDIYGNLGVLPRGQKEIGHQPHSVFLLGMRSEYDANTRKYNLTWNITTGKDLPGRDYFDKEELDDFAIEYLALHYNP